MNSVEIIGLVAGAITTTSFMPQVIRVFKLKSAHEISLLFNVLLLIGTSTWLGYGIYLGLLPLILWNAIGVILIGTLLLAKLKYGR